MDDLPIHAQNVKNRKQVSMDMKSALVCLQGLGVRVKGPLEDPAVASWLAEPPIDDAAVAALGMNPPPHESKKRKSSKALRALPKACVTSLALPRRGTVAFGPFFRGGGGGGAVGSWVCVRVRNR